VRLSYFCSKLNKYITKVPKGYKTDMVFFYQISRTQQKKRHSNWMTRAPRNGPQRCAPQQLPCIKNGFGLENLQHKPALNPLPWPQEGLVYIDLKLVTISQLPPKIWPKKGPNIPPKGPNISKTVPKIIENHCSKVKKPLYNYYWAKPL
jgi:hypothetical protein